jgi:Cu(I)/Ag(I) efflux system membrane fusion protein
MSDQSMAHPQGFEDGRDPLAAGGLKAPPGLSRWGKVWWWFHFLILVQLARLRFIGILFAIGALILYWDSLVAVYEKWTRPSTGAEQAASSEYDYFCPMHPQVVTDKPNEKCPICFMNLSRRKKGEAAGPEALPPGVVSRIQLSPYKVVTAGIRTWDVKYEPLVKRIETVGSVEFDERKLRRIPSNVKGRIDKLIVNVTGQIVHAGDELASVYSPDVVTTVQNLLDAQQSGNREDVVAMAAERLRLWGITQQQIDAMRRGGRAVTHVAIRSPLSGHVVRKYQIEGQWVDETAPLYDVADLSTVWITAQVYEKEVSYLRVGLPVRATTDALPGKLFTGRIAFRDPHLDQATRTLRVRFDIDNPDHELKHEDSLLPGTWATVWVDVPAGELAQRFQSRDGGVLAVPELSVIQTGSQKMVFRQDAPMVYDAVQVELGPPITGPDDTVFYPVLKGLRAGDRIVTVGSYLLDADTRVSAAAGSIYYGGGGAGGKANSTAVTSVRPSTPEDEEVKVQANLAKLSTPDRRLAEAQKVCPVRGTRLGSMGPPVEVVLKGRHVLLCCKGCVEEATSNPDGTLSALDHRKAEAAPPGNRQARIAANLAKLGEADRRLAEAQKVCPVQGTLLGLMGKPVRILLNGQTFFLCCPNCKEDARANPEKTLATLQRLTVKAAAPQP